MIILNIVYAIVGIFVLIFLDGMLTSLFGFKAIFFVLLFLYRKLDWKILLCFSVFVFLISDVMSHYILGTNFIIGLLSLVFYASLSLLFSTERGFFSYVLISLTFLVYYVLLWILPNLFLTTTLDPITWKIIGIFVIKAVFSSLIMAILNIISGRFRDRGNSSKLRLK